MIKEKLMQALKVAAAEYNGGTSANAAIAKAAEAADFNEHQTDRLVEMFNTLAAINKEQDASDSTGSCELADKKEVSKLLMNSSMRKAACDTSHGRELEYTFYSSEPEKTNPTIEARRNGIASFEKAASSKEHIPEELDISERSLYKVICGKIDLLKAASESADDAARALQIEIERSVVKIAKAIENPFAPSDAADMFKAACKSDEVVGLVSEYSTKVAESTGGVFSKMEVFDATPVEDLLKIASEIEEYSSQIPEFTKKRDFYLSKASEAENSMKSILGFSNKVRNSSLADFFNPASVVKNASDSDPATSADTGKDKMSVSEKIAEIVRKSGIKGNEIDNLLHDLEKDAATALPRTFLNIDPLETFSVLRGNVNKGITDEDLRLQNVERGLILSDLIANDPILRDVDPTIISQIYKSIVRSSPRISLDPAMVVAALRSAANSVAFSPADAKILTDVDKGMALSNMARLTNLDSSIKDSNMA